MSFINRVIAHFSAELVGQDPHGNKYYRKSISAHLEKRFVLYAETNDPEALSLPTSWYIWLHRLIDTPPTKDDSSKTERPELYKPVRVNYRIARSYYQSWIKSRTYLTNR
jgi:NADH:ubiquinone oxidoreductase subunit